MRSASNLDLSRAIFAATRRNQSFSTCALGSDFSKIQNNFASLNNKLVRQDRSNRGKTGHRIETRQSLLGFKTKSVMEGGENVARAPVKVAVGQMTAVSDKEANFVTCKHLAEVDIH